MLSHDSACTGHAHCSFNVRVCFRKNHSYISPKQVLRNPQTALTLHPACMSHKSEPRPGVCTVSPVRSVPRLPGWSSWRLEGDPRGKGGAVFPTTRDCFVGTSTGAARSLRCMRTCSSTPVYLREDPVLEAPEARLAKPGFKEKSKGNQSPLSLSRI